MTRDEKMVMLKILIQDIDAEDALLDVYLDVSEAEIKRRAYPFEDIDSVPFPSSYDVLSVQIAQSIYLKSGAQNEVQRSENGVSRTFSTDGIPKSLLSQIVPLVGTIKRTEPTP
jgi:hypothetical protein